ncbi:hypothetical protein [Kiloniella sp.]|uniref:hypothetical protein n=1 Tax=Kiloniella sp. TaxID=1938587 RepID=UPI003B011FCF
MYEVHSIDGVGNRTLAKIIEPGATIGRVGAQVIAIGFNDKYLIAKRLHEDKITVSYYIVDKTRDGIYKNASEITEGPFNQEAFQKLKQERKLPEFSEQFTQY